jgi:hypothetical protein
VHTTRTKRAGRIYLTHLALRGLLTYGEIDRYASIIDERRRRRQPLRPQLRPDPLVARNRPTPQTVKRAAEALATCVRAAHQAEPENLLKNEENAMYRVLAFIGIDRRSHRPALTPAAAKKRAQRERQRMAPIVAAQRERLDAEVAAGRMIRLSEFAYVNAD